MKLVIFSLAELLSNFLNLGQYESEIIGAIIIFSLAAIIGLVIYQVLKKYLSRWAKRTNTNIEDEILRNIRAPVLVLSFLLGIYYA
ncbi:MAG: hypothetical protein JSV51_03375, partial [Candidatus Bathyarchaeota archaeon]